MASSVRRWQFDLKQSSTRDSRDPPALPKPPGLEKGAVAAITELDHAGKARIILLKEKRAMQIATAPFKSVGMNAFMLWMCGSTIQIMSIMMLSMVLSSNVNAIKNTNKVFAKLDDGTVKLLIPKLTYVAISLAGCGLGLYKCATMGLLPVTSADWTNYLLPKVMMEHSGAPLSL